MNEEKTIELTPKQERHLNRKANEMKKAIEKGEVYRVTSVEEMMRVLNS